jgi:hypothetical protein
MHKSTSILLTIPQPCSQNWEEMQANGTSRFCDSCNKSVIDFTQYSDQQLIDFLYKSSGEVCGNLRPDQLEKPLHSIHHSNKRLVPQLLLSTVLTIGLGNSVYAKEKQEVRSIHTVTTEKKVEQKANRGSGCDNIRCITGTVTDKSNKEPIRGVTILIEGTTVVTAADTNGYFSLNVSDYLQTDTVKLIIFALGYENVTLKFTQQDFIKNSIIERNAELSPALMLRGGLSISYQKATLWQRTKYFFRNMFR